MTKNPNVKYQVLRTLHRERSHNSLGEKHPELNYPQIELDKMD